ncbi:MAG: TetR/AcrR family transcriptional regulator [Dehalococcoidia bacterium]|nr:TetR/AcrR family transcriptional regulator [Dehalococcoidia bacterium]
MSNNNLDMLGSYQEVADKLGQQAGHKKWEIVKAAAGLFIRKGTLNTGVRDIAEASGITVGTLYHYFRSKDEIISAFLDFAVQSTNEFVRMTTEILARLPPREAMERALRLYMEYTNEAQSIVLFWHQETRNLATDQRKRLMENDIVLASLFEKLIELGRHQGIYKIKDAALAAHSIIVLGDMWAFRRWWLGRRYTSDQYIDEQTKFILHGLYNGSL